MDPPEQVEMETASLCSWVRSCLGSEVRGIDASPTSAPVHELPGWTLEFESAGATQRVRVIGRAWGPEPGVCFHFWLEDPSRPPGREMTLRPHHQAALGLVLEPRPRELVGPAADILLGGVGAPYRVLDYVPEATGPTAKRIVLDRSAGNGPMRRIFESDGRGGCRFLTLQGEPTDGDSQEPTWLSHLGTTVALDGFPWPGAAPSN